MTQPQVITRALTFNFDQVITAATGLPDVLDISVIPLANSTNAQAGVTFAGGLQSTRIELSQPVNSWTINLIPSNLAGLDTVINYRVLWRSGILGPTTTYDFSMPDADLTFDELIAGTANIISGETYIQQTDLGVPGGVAQIDQYGNVLNASGLICATESDITAVNNSITAETNRAEAAEAAITNSFDSTMATQNASTLSTAQAYTDAAVGPVSAALTTETQARTSAVSGLQTQITSNATALATTNGQISSLQSAASNYATLTGGYLTTTQFPPTMHPKAYPVANQIAMLAMSASVVHPGDFAVRPDGTFVLNGTDPTQLSNWVNLSTVVSVNGQSGVVNLSAADVNAMAVGASVSMSQVTGLNTALLGYATTANLTALQTQVTSLLGSTTGSTVNGNAVAYFLNTGILSDAAMPADAAFVNSSNQVVSKTGGLVGGGGGGGGGTITEVNGQTGPVVNLTLSSLSAAGGTITQAQVTGLSTALSGLVSTTDSRLANARTPTAHASTHQQGGSDVLTLNQSQVSGLSAILSNNALTSSSNAVNRISTLEGEVVSLQSGGGGGGGGGTSTTSLFWTSANQSTEVSNFANVFLHSPFGIDSDGTITGTIGTPYYLATGVRTQDAAYAYVTPGGHLKVVVWNEANAADPVYATQAALTTLQTQVGGLASTSSVTALSNQINSLATQSALSALQTQVNGCATTTQLNSTNATVATLATQSALATLQAQVNTLAPQSQVTTLAGNITALQAAASNYATLTAGVLTSSQIPTNIPQANIQGLVTALGNCATLSGGKLAASQIPTNIPQANIQNLSSTLAGYATLTGNYLTPAQIPPSVVPQVLQVANTAAMTALTGAYVGNICQVTGGSGAGTYVLAAQPASTLGNWYAITSTAPPVTSVNTLTGAVVLTAASVGALASNASIPISQITGLSTQLSTFATSAALTSAMTSVPTFAQVQTMLSASSQTKRADYVATSALASLSGLQSVDGVLVPSGATILATAQPSSVNNGLWIASSGAWQRATDYATGSYLSKDTLVFVANQTGSANGTNLNDSIWQMSAASGFIDTNGASWTQIGWDVLPFTPSAGNGLSIVGSAFSAKTVTGGGILATSSGLSVDPNVVAKKFVGAVPAGAQVASITHNLNTNYPTVTVWNTSVSPPQIALPGVQSTGPNTVALSFANAPITGEYQVVIIG